MRNGSLPASGSGHARSAFGQNLRADFPTDLHDDAGGNDSRPEEFFFRLKPLGPFCASLLALGRQLKNDAYAFVTTTPATHLRVLERPNSGSDVLRQLFGWNREIDAGSLPSRYRAFMENPELFYPSDGNHLRARVRFSSFHNLLLAHSGFPTIDPDAVFFGPDTYRFGRAITVLRESEPDFHPRRVIDVGAGSGAGGLLAATTFGASEIVLSDINPHALEFAMANAVLNGLDRVECSQSDILEDIPGLADLIISNPPYLVDPQRRAYRHGGGSWGDALAGRIVTRSLDRLTPCGRLMLYTGTPVVEGRDMFLEAISPLLRKRVSRFRYEELDPDVFGEELDHPPYDKADRIATVVLHVNAKDLLR